MVSMSGSGFSVDSAGWREVEGPRDYHRLWMIQWDERSCVLTGPSDCGKAFDMAYALRERLPWSGRR